MKKFLSLSLALTMLVSLLCIVPAQAAPYEGYPYLYEDFESAEDMATIKPSGEATGAWQAGGVGGSKGALKITEASASNVYQQVQFPVDWGKVYNGKTIRFSCWIKPEVAPKASKNVNFIIYGKTKSGKTGWLEIIVSDAGLKDNEWTYVSATKVWDGLLNVGGTFEEFDSNALAESYLNIRIGRTLSKGDPAPFTYLIDDVIVEPINDVNDQASVAADPSILTKGMALDSDADVAAWKQASGNTVAPKFVKGVSPDGSAGCMMLDFKKGVFSEVTQTIALKTNRLYKLSFDAKSVNRDSIGYSFITWAPKDRKDFQQWYGQNSNGLVITKEWGHFEMYIMGTSKIGDAAACNWGPRFADFSAREHVDVLQSSLQMYIDNMYIKDMGVVANSDFETASVPEGMYFKEGKAAHDTYKASPVPFWYSNNATIAQATDVRESYEEGETASTKSMKVTVGTNGGYAYQPVVIEDAVDYKFTFWAKGVNATGDQAVSLQLDRTVASVDAKDKLDVNDIDVPVAAETQYLTNEWQKFEFTYRSEYGGDNKLSFPRAPYMNIMIGDNAAGTTYFIDDFKVEEYDPNYVEVKYPYPYAEEGSVLFSGDAVAGSTMEVEYFFVSDVEAMEGTSVLRLKKKFGAGEVIVDTQEAFAGYGEIEIPDSLAGEDIAIELALIDEEGRMGNVYRYEIDDIKKAFAVTPTFGWNYENNEISASVTIEHNAASRGDQKMLIVLAQFDKNGAMIDVATKAVDVTVDYNNTVKLSDTVNAKYSMATIFVWSGTSLADAGELVYTDSRSIAG